MNFKKRASKSIALALVGVAVTTPVLSNVNAMQNNTGLENKNIQILNDSEETETINEYLKLKELNKKSESKLREIGYSDQDIKQIREYKEAFSENIDELNELSNEFLSGLGYDNEQINIIRNFDGSEEQMIRASATCTVTRSKDSFYYDKTNKATNLVVNFSFKWNGAPLFRGTDLMAVSNGERMYFHNNSYLNVSYQPLNSSGVSSSKKISASIDGAGNTGASFKFKVLGNNGLTYAKSGQGKVYLHRKNEDIKQVGVGVTYGHSTLSISPSVSFPASAGISFSSKVESIGPNQLMCYR